MRTKLSGKFWLALTLFSLIGQVAWVVENMYLNVFIYEMFNASAADISNMVAASAVAATLTTVFMGALSDKIGKRKLFICAGYILWGVSIFAFTLINKENINAIFPMTVSAAATGATLTIILDCIMTFFGSTANDAAFNAWLTDSTDSTNRGAAEGINSMMPLVAILVVFGGFMFFDLNKAESWKSIFTIIGLVVTAIGILGCFIIKDAPIRSENSGYFKTVIHGFLPTTARQNSALYITLLLFIIFNISIQIFMPYLIIYYEVSLGMTDYVFIMAPAIIIASAVTAFWGKFYDKNGFGTSSLISLLWLVSGYVLLFLFRSTALVFIGSLLMMCGYLGSAAVFGAAIRDLTPEGKAGRFQGVRIFSQVLVPGIVGPFIGKTVLKGAQTITNDDGTVSFVPNRNIFLAALAAAVLLLLLLPLLRKKKQTRFAELTTPYESNTSDWITEHPSPQFKRDAILSLCGKWQLSVQKSDYVTPLGDITVPFPPESRISGIKRELSENEKYIYEKQFTLPQDFNGKNVILHFGAVDQIAEVYVNGSFAIKNIGGYLPFKTDITKLLTQGVNTVKVLVTDKLDKTLPYGKQCRKRGGMWYTPISGIWQPVWLEAVPENYIEYIKISTTLESVTITTLSGEDEKTLILEDKEYTFSGSSITVTIENPILWTPENPHLYYFTLICGEDKVESYFALRTVSVERFGDIPCICLNKKPYFFNGLLDQGYYSDGIYTPASPKGYLDDIMTAKKLGFNMLRKHIKTEPEIFYYYCDKYGMVVFQDMVNSGEYNFLIDTALPTAGFKQGISHRATKQRRQYFEAMSETLIENLYNHPCVCYYTIFNEGWGQYDCDNVYRTLKALDPSRVFDTASGWFVPKESDVKSDHTYFKKLNSKKQNKLPLVLSEFGGYVIKVSEHSFNLDNTYGYKLLNSQEELTRDLERLYNDEVISEIKEKGLCAAILTQISDVEDETNGLITYDRQVLKVDPERMIKISENLNKAFAEKFKV